jgi:hypothetical protein
MGTRHFGWWVTRVVARLVDMFEVTFRQFLAFNEETSLQRRVPRVVARLVDAFEALVRL